MFNSKHEVFLKNVLDKMFNIVGLEEYDEKFTKKEAWYTKKKWTLEQQEDFRIFFISEARKTLKLSKRVSEKELLWFNLMYGWSLKKDDQILPKSKICRKPKKII